jgi:hypothetical protein
MTAAQALYLTGGRQRPNPKRLPQWQVHQSGVLLEVSVDGELIRRLEHEVPSELRAPGLPAASLRGAHLDGERIVVCSQTEVLGLRTSDLQRGLHLSLPAFNDLHHVRPSPGGLLLVANTGLDMVVEVGLDGGVVREWSVVDEPVWTRFSRDVDYRRIDSTKPHRSHPSFVFYLEDEVWVTRFHQRDAISLTQPGRRIDIGFAGPHDGIVTDSHVWFTSVDGKIVRADRDTLLVDEVVDLTAITPRTEPLGWCRGILIEGDAAWVGFSRLRPTRFRENVEWVRETVTGSRAYQAPTRIARYDLSARKLTAEIELEAFGLNTVFSILPVP